MEQMSWCKWWDGSSSDPKFRMIAERNDISVAAVLGVWAYLLEAASRSDLRGNIASINMEIMAYTLMFPKAETVCNDMKRSGLVTETGDIVKWEKRQSKRENQEPPGASTKRVQALRERQRAVNGGTSLDPNSGNAECNDVTPCNDMERPKRREEKNKILNPSSTSVDEAGPFDVFWQAYPRRVGKLKARKAWIKIAPSATLVATMLAAIKAHAAGPDWQLEAGKRIPHPVNWLEGGCWLDEVRAHPVVAVAKPTAPTPYIPPLPSTGGECDLSTEQRQARLDVLRKTLKRDVVLA